MQQHGEGSEPRPGDIVYHRDVAYYNLKDNVEKKGYELLCSGLEPDFTLKWTLQAYQDVQGNNACCMH